MYLISRKEHERVQQFITDSEEAINGLYDKFDSLERNGVVTAIGELNREVLTDMKRNDTKSDILFHFMNEELPQEPTLKGKVEAIAKHLGLDFTVTPKKVIEAKVAVSKVKAPAKKVSKK